MQERFSWEKIFWARMQKMQKHIYQNLLMHDEFVGEKL